MFTGIVEEVGTILEINEITGSIKIEAQVVVKGTKKGDSISVNGTCLTVTHCSKNSFDADLSPVTIQRTNFLELAPGDRVNLERALAANDRLGGHFVLGHVDCKAQVVSVKDESKSLYIQFKYPYEYCKYIADKASVAVNGVSLTAAFFEENYFTVVLIPHTLSNCNLTDLKPEDTVNLEFDILSKYIERLVNTGSIKDTGKKKSSITMDFLEDNGF